MKQAKSGRRRTIVRPWYFFVLAIIFGVLMLFGLRNNNEQMVVLRQAVYEADQGGDQAKLDKALYNLRVHVYSHMNTSLTTGSNSVYPPIQLKYSYERALANQQQQLGTNNSNVYHDAQVQCANSGQSNTGAEAIACINSYVAERGIQLTDIPDGLYKFDFVSATWSPDLAGWSMLLTIFFAAGFVFLLIKKWWRSRTEELENIAEDEA